MLNEPPCGDFGWYARNLRDEYPGLDLTNVEASAITRGMTKVSIGDHEMTQLEYSMMELYRLFQETPYWTDEQREQVNA